LLIKYKVDSYDFQSVEQVFIDENIEFYYAIYDQFKEQ